jgi:DNA-binding transcriptional LysR family regulator
MVRRHYSLPSLNALAAFEAAARHLSLTRAATELNVTPGAVSKQVKALESEIGRPLFLRLHRAMELTPEGETVARALQEAFERVSATLQQVSQNPALRSVSIGSTMAFAQFWLMPRLHDFWNAHQDIVIDHMISDRNADLFRNDVDLRIRYGDGEWQDETAVKLFDDRIAAVASPGFAARHKVKQAKDMAGLPLLSVEGVDWTWTTWSDFLRAAPQARPAPLQQLRHRIAGGPGRAGPGPRLDEHDQAPAVEACAGTGHEQRDCGTSGLLCDLEQQAGAVARSRDLARLAAVPIRLSLPQARLVTSSGCALQVPCA